MRAQQKEREKEREREREREVIDKYTSSVWGELGLSTRANIKFNAT